MINTVSLKLNRDFRRLYAKGKSAATPFLAIYCRKNGRGQNRLGLTVGGKVGNAVVRNRVRRRIREVYRSKESLLETGYDIVIVARVRAASGRYQDLEKSFGQLVRKVAIEKKDCI